MASSQTPHHEIYDEEQDIMIYVIRMKDIFDEDIKITYDTVGIVRERIPDIADKCTKSSHSRKVILVHSDELPIIVQKRYFIFFIRYVV